MRDPEAISRTADQCVELCGGLPSMIVNNAAGNFIAPTERLSANAWRTIVDIVLNGTALVTMEFGRRLIAAKQGRFSYQPLSVFGKNLNALTTCMYTLYWYAVYIATFESNGL